MKKLLIIWAITTISFATFATATFVNSNHGTFISFGEKVKISPDELPAPVKTAIEDDFSNWEIKTVYLYTESKQYEVEFKQATKMKTVKFDKDGNVLG